MLGEELYANTKGIGTFMSLQLTVNLIIIFLCILQQVSAL